MRAHPARENFRYKMPTCQAAKTLLLIEEEGNVQRLASFLEFNFSIAMDEGDEDIELTLVKMITF